MHTIEIPRGGPHQVSLADRLAMIRRRIEDAAASAGRDPAGISLVAVSKTHDAGAVLEAIAAGQGCFGENRVQEAKGKFAPILAAHPRVALHLIGQLQTNKAREAVRLCHVIQSLDRPGLVRAIADAAQREGRCPGLLVQVNVGDEAQKAGVSRAEADGFIDTCRAAFGERLLGLMGIPPAAVDPGPYFAWLAACRDRHGLPILSIGMSADFEQAIRAGATHVRVGSAIFGSRPPSAAPADGRTQS